MTTTEITEKKLESAKPKMLEPKLGEIVSRKGKDEIVVERTIRETYEDERRLVGFGTIRREEDGGIIESHYSVSREGEEHQNYSGVFYSEEHPPFHASEGYSMLNKILEQFGK